MTSKMLDFFTVRMVMNCCAKRQTMCGLLILEGQNSQEIADEMKISIKMVKQHITNIYKKCKVESRAQFIVQFYSAYIEQTHTGEIKHNVKLARQNSSVYK